jgi:hypothetical protein
MVAVIRFGPKAGRLERRTVCPITVHDLFLVIPEPDPPRFLYGRIATRQGKGRRLGNLLLSQSIPCGVKHFSDPTTHYGAGACCGRSKVRAAASGPPRPANRQEAGAQVVRRSRHRAGYRSHGKLPSPERSSPRFRYACAVAKSIAGTNDPRAAAQPHARRSIARNTGRQHRLWSGNERSLVPACRCAAARRAHPWRCRRQPDKPDPVP